MAKASTNLALFFEGTGQGVPGKSTNVTRLHDACRADEGQRLHLEAGLGTHLGAWLGGRVIGSDWSRSFAAARRWFEQTSARIPARETPVRVFLFGFSRGATLARHFAAWLDKLGVPVAFLGLWDTVDSIAGLDVSETCPPNVRAARHAIARDEQRRFFDFVPLRAPSSPIPAGSSRQRVQQMVFPGVHSDVGGGYADNHVIADIALAWVVQAAQRQGLRLAKGVRFLQRFDPAQVRLHDSRRLVSNLWGALGSAVRVLDGIPRHRACRFCPAVRSEERS